MKEFSKKWKSSKKANKQRKFTINAPLHIKHRFMNAKVSEEVSKKYGVKRIAVRKGDKVRIMRGQFSSKTGKVNKVDLSGSRVYVDGIDRTKIDGSKAFYPIHPSNVMIIDMTMEDKRRIKVKKK